MKLQIVFSTLFILVYANTAEAQQKIIQYKDANGMTHSVNINTLPSQNSTNRITPQNNNTPSKPKIYKDDYDKPLKKSTYVPDKDPKYYYEIPLTDLNGNLAKYNGDQLYEKVAYSFPLGATYVGEKTRGGVPNGQGKMTYTDGSVQDGTWTNGHFVEPDPNRNQFYRTKDFEYYGQLDKNGLPSGQGTATDTKKSWKGKWEFGRPLGYMTAEYNNGDKFLGVFIDTNQPFGGKYTWNSGLSFEGGFNNGIPFHVGVLTWPSGNFYSGNVKDSLMNGYGKLYSADAVLIREGTWQNNKFLSVKKDTSRVVNQQIEMYVGIKIQKLKNAIQKIKDANIERNKNNPVQVFTNIRCGNIDLTHGYLLATKNDGSIWRLGKLKSYYSSTNQLFAEKDDKDYDTLKVANPNEWKTIKCSYDFTMGLKTDGSLWQWVSGVPQQKGINKEWLSINVGEDAVLIKTDGTLWTIKPGKEGAVEQVGVDNDWIKTFSGDYSNFAQKKDGTIWGWGSNRDYKLGIGWTSNTKTVDLPEKILSKAANWKDISCGSNFALFIKTDGTLWGCGNNKERQLGIGNLSGQPDNEDYPIQLGKDTDWLQVSAGYNHSLGLKKDGTLWAWGKNDEGQLGVAGGQYNELNDYSDYPVQVGKDKDWKMVSASNKLSFALKNDGTLWEWGSKTDWIK